MDMKTKSPALAASGSQNNCFPNRDSTPARGVVYYLPDRRRKCAGCGIPFRHRASHHQLCSTCFSWRRAGAHNAIARHFLREAAALRGAR